MTGRWAKITTGILQEGQKGSPEKGYPSTAQQADKPAGFRQCLEGAGAWFMCSHFVYYRRIKTMWKDHTWNPFIVNIYSLCLSPCSRPWALWLSHGMWCCCHSPANLPSSLMGLCHYLFSVMSHAASSMTNSISIIPQLPTSLLPCTNYFYVIIYWYNNDTMSKEHDK